MGMRAAALCHELSIKFRGPVESTGVAIPVAAIAALGAASHDRVFVTLDGQTYGGVVTVVGERSLVSIDADAGVLVGDMVDVELTLDSEPEPAMRFARQIDRRARSAA